jgi:hypothetical protein
MAASGAVRLIVDEPTSPDTDLLERQPYTPPSVPRHLQGRQGAEVRDAMNEPRERERTTHISSLLSTASPPSRPPFLLSWGVPKRVSLQAVLAVCGMRSALFTAQLGTVQLVRRKIVIMMEYLCVCLLVTVPPTSIQIPSSATWVSLLHALHTGHMEQCSAVPLPESNASCVCSLTPNLVAPHRTLPHITRHRFLSRHGTQHTATHTTTTTTTTTAVCVCPSADVDLTLMAICECRIGMIGQQTVHQTSRST